MGAHWFRLSAENISCNPRKSGWPRKKSGQTINATDNTDAILAEAEYIFNNADSFIADEEYALAA